MTLALKKPDKKTPGRAAEISLADVDPHPQQPRTDFDTEEIKTLAASLADVGLMNRVHVRKKPDGRYELLAGERRCLAATVAGWGKVPAMVCQVDDQTALKMLVRENIDRKDLNAIERARALALLCRPADQGGAGMTEAKAAAMFGHKQAWAGNLLRLLRLPEAWQARVISGEIGPSHARALVPFVAYTKFLEKVSAAIAARPDAWRAIDDFEHNLCVLAIKHGGRVEQTARVSLNRKSRRMTVPGADDGPAADNRQPPIGGRSPAAESGGPDRERIERAAANPSPWHTKPEFRRQHKTACKRASWRRRFITKAWLAGQNTGSGLHGLVGEFYRMLDGPTLRQIAADAEVGLPDGADDKAVIDALFASRIPVPDIVWRGMETQTPAPTETPTKTKPARKAA